MSEKSKVKINPTKFQKNLNAVCWILFLAFLGYSFFAWQNLPDMIPRHFNALGEIDAYWSKSYFWFLPIISLVLFALMSVLEHFPQSWNLPQKKGDDLLQNERNLSLAYSMMIWLKLECVIVFWLMTAYTAKCANLPSVFLLISMFVIFATMGYYIYRMYRKTEGEKS